MENMVGDLSVLSVAKEISAVDALLLHAINDPEKNQRMIQDQARYFIEGYRQNVAAQNDTMRLDRIGITTTIFTQFLSEVLTPEQKEKMRELGEELSEKSEITKKLKSDLLRLEDQISGVTGENAEYDESLWSPDALPAPFRLGNKVLELAALKKVAQLQASFAADPTKSTYVAEVVPGKTEGVSAVFVNRVGKHRVTSA